MFVKSFSKFFFVFALLLLLSSSVSAETLEDAWKIALSVDNRLQASKKTTESLKETLASAKSARWPSLNIESGYTILNHAPAAVVDSPNFPLKEFPTAEDKSFSYKTTLTLPLYTSGGISQGIHAASSGFKAAFQDEIKTSLDVKMDVADAYVGVLRAKRLVEVSESNVSSLSAHVNDVTNLYEQGMVTKNDLLAAKVSLADARQRLIQAQNNLDIARAAYNRLLGRPLDQEVAISDVSAGPIELNQETLIAQALKKRPELISLSEQAQSLKHQAAGVRASGWPQIALSGGYNYQQNKYMVFEDLWSATIGLKWEIFDGGIIRHNANALMQKADALNRLHDDAASVVTLQVRQTYLDVEETMKRIEVTREATAQADENLRVTRDRYREGVGTNTEVLDAETLRVRSYTSYYTAVYDAAIARYRLRYVVGDL